MDNLRAVCKECKKYKTMQRREICEDCRGAFVGLVYTASVLMFAALIVRIAVLGV